MFDRLGRVVLRARIPIVLAWLLLTVASMALVPPLASVTSSQESGFLPAGSPARVAAERLAAAFPDDHGGASATVVFARPEGALSDGDRRAVETAAAWLRGADVPAALANVVIAVEGAADVPDLAAMYRSQDGAVEMLSVRLDVDPMSEDAREAILVLREGLAPWAGDGLEVSVTGTTAITADYLAAVIEGTDRTTLVTIVLVVLILLLVYRAPVAATVPLLTIGAAFAVARAVLSLLAMAGWQIPSLLDTFIVVLIFGVGTDYAIFLLSRYREELGRTSREGAAAATVGRIGAVITASAATVIVGLGSMAVASFEMIQTIGPALSISVGITLAAGLTLTPALAMLAGRWLYWPRHEAVLDGSVHAVGAWDRLAAFIVARPGRVALGVVVVLAIPLLALPAMKVEFDQLKELPPTVEARRGFDRVAAHFERGQLLPVSVLVEAADGADLGSPAGLAAIASMVHDLMGVDGVRSVRSIVTPAGDGVVPDGLRPSSRLESMTAGLAGGDDPMAALAALADPATIEGLDGALGYLEALATAYPDVAAGPDLATVRTRVADLRAAVADYQAAAGQAGRSAALMAASQAGSRLPDEVAVLAETFRARPDDVFLPRSMAAADPATARLLRTYVAVDGRATQLTLVTADEAYSPSAFETVRRVRDLLDEGASPDASRTHPLIARAYVGGPTATSADVQAATTEDFKAVGLITVLGVFLVLVVLLRSIVAPVYLVGTVLLSYGTTMGVATLLFQGVLDQDGINYLVPLIVFVLLVALGSDYNIFLMSRVREESDRADLRSGITLATARTGTVITSAGIILAGTFVALTVAPLQIMQQIGLTVAIGVLIDTFIVRSLLIPALTALIGDRTWWPSVRKQRLTGSPA